LARVLSPILKQKFLQDSATLRNLDHRDCASSMHMVTTNLENLKISGNFIFTLENSGNFELKPVIFRYHLFYFVFFFNIILKTSTKNDLPNWLLQKIKNDILALRWKAND